MSASSDLTATLKKITEKLNKSLPEPMVNWQELNEVTRFMIEGSGWRDWPQEFSDRYEPGQVPVEKVQAIMPDIQKAVKKFERDLEKEYQKNKWGSLPPWKFQFEKLAAKPKVDAPKLADLTDAQKKEFKQALSRTWQAIGYDILSAGGGDSIPRDEVIEVVLDADHVSTYGGVRDPVVKAFLQHGDYKELTALAKEEFRASRYGM